MENSVLQNQAEMSPPWPSRLLAGMLLPPPSSYRGEGSEASRGSAPGQCEAGPQPGCLPSPDARPAEVSTCAGCSLLSLAQHPSLPGLGPVCCPGVTSGDITTASACLLEPVFATPVPTFSTSKPQPPGPHAACSTHLKLGVSHPSLGSPRNPTLALTVVLFTGSQRKDKTQDPASHLCSTFTISQHTFLPVTLSCECRQCHMRLHFPL